MATEADTVNGVADLDSIWTSSKTARQIYALSEVEKVSEESFEGMVIN
jgi:hypothetical protein